MDTRRKAEPAAPKEPLRVRFDRFELDEDNARLTLDGCPVPLAPRPFELLCSLARTPQTLITKNQLLDRVWGQRFVGDAVLRTAMSDLRSALREDPKRPRVVETVSRRGYRFIAPLTDSRAAPAAPSCPGSTMDSSMVGRDDALDRLRAAWQLARAGRRQIVWIGGEAGVGKTTLIERFLGEVGEPHCAHGQCLEQHGAREPYLPVLEALTALCRHEPKLAPLVREVAPSWLLRLPWLGGIGGGENARGGPVAGPSCVLREMGELLDRCTERRPLVLVTEDLHWSDPATVQLIDYIARRRSATRLLWVASFRLTEVIAVDQPLKAVRHELGLHGLAEEIVLDAFSEKEVAEYLAPRQAALAADEDFVRALHRRTDGLPLFVADVVDGLVEQGGGDADAASAHRRLAATALPETLGGIVERYVAQLTPEQRSLLEVASLCGSEFRLSTVAGVLGRDAGTLVGVWSELTRGKRWLRESSSGPHGDGDEARYSFRHALYREVLLKQHRRLAGTDLHDRIADALARDREPARGAPGTSPARLVA